MRRCEQCRERDASEILKGRICPRCAMQAAVDNLDLDEAYAIAEDHDYPASTVRVLQRAAQARKMRGAVAKMVAALDAVPHQLPEHAGVVIDSTGEVISVARAA